MAFYVYHPVKHAFLGFDERSWESNIAKAAAFTSREVAEEIAEREVKDGYDAYVFDDGAD